MRCSRCGNTTNGHSENGIEYCTVCGGELPRTTPARVNAHGRYNFPMRTSPVGDQVTWDERDRTFIVDVVGFYRRELPACIMLKTRHFNGEAGPDVSAGAVRVLERTYE